MFILLLAAVIVLGGFIAFLGDKVATKTGRKKLSLWNLRPKYTSMLVAIITGSLIASATLGIILILSQDARTAVFNMESIKDELSHLTGEVSEQSKALDESRKAYEIKNAQYNDLVAKIDEKNEQLYHIEEELALSKNELNATKNKVTHVTKELTLNKIELDDTKNHVAVLTHSETELKRNVELFKNISTDLFTGIETVRGGHLAFLTGETLFVGVIKKQDSAQNFEEIMHSIIYKANQEVLKRMHLSPNNFNFLWFDPSNISQAVSIISETPGDVVVRICSRGNYLFGEMLPGEIKVTPYRKLYSKGSLVYSGIVKSPLNSHEAENTMNNFLKNTEIAIRTQHMLPYDSDDGGISIDKNIFDDAIQTLINSKSQVMMLAVVKEDVFTSEPIKLEILVK